MKNLKQILITGLLVLTIFNSFAQSKIIGKIIDSQLNAELPGANVVVTGTKTGVSSDIDGKFSLNVQVTTGTLTISSVGFQSKKVAFTIISNRLLDLGTISLEPEENNLDEIVLKSNLIDIAKDRKTPVAVSTITGAEIQRKLGNQEFPEILKNTPSVYTSKAGGGFGDSRITIRGFSQNNIAVMINGVPVNDMENSNVFWSNWAGLSDVTSVMQVQRGLGSSKLAISSIGGTINVVTRSSDLPEGGSVSSSVGNNNYLKTQASYNTGLMKNGLSASFLYSTTSGEGYVDGTRFDGRNYYFALGYKKGNHDLQFTMTGAPQWHDQRITNISIATAIKYGNTVDVPNRQYNADWGYLNGEEINMRRNYYHKPVMSINWDWKINSTTKLSTILYGSWGRGAGASGAGGIRGLNYANVAFRKLDGTGTVDFDKIQAYNSGQPININGNLVTRTQVGGQYENTLNIGTDPNPISGGTGIPNSYFTNTGISRISSFNSHDWYGGIIDLNKKIGSNLTLDLGIDARTYVGIHYQNVNNFFGSTTFNASYNIPAGTNNINQPTYYVNDTYSVTPSNNPFAKSSVDQKIGYDYDGKVNWFGAFTQLEYSKNNVTAYIQGAISQQGFAKVDRFTYLSSDPLSSTNFKNIVGYDVKGGINYNINNKNNVFINAGTYSKQPFFNAVYTNNRSLINPNLTNEKVVGLEAGYGFKSKYFVANFNVYHTTWKDRVQTSIDNAATNIGGYFVINGLQEVHDGAELELKSNITTKLKLTGMISYGDWKYNGNSATSDRYNLSNVNINANGVTTTLYLDNVNIGNAAQTVASIGVIYDVLKNLSIDATYNYYERLYANLNPSNFGLSTNKGALQLPAFGLMDAGFSYKLSVGKDKANSVNFRCNVNNVLDKIYIAESSSNTFILNQSDFVIASGANAGQPNVAAYNTYVANLKTYNGLDVNNNVFFGFGRTWNLGLTFKF